MTVNHAQKIGNPECVEQVPSARLLPVVFPEVDEVEDIRMPGLNVYSEGVGPFVASLVDITSRSVLVPAM